MFVTAGKDDFEAILLASHRSIGRYTIHPHRNSSSAVPVIMIMVMIMIESSTHNI